MKGQTIDLIKDLIISILIIVCICIIISIVFYDEIALVKVIPEAEEYTLTGEMKNELEDSQLDDEQEIIINYYIDASDLKKYEKTNQYIKGKSNPFAEVGNFAIGNNIVDGENDESTNTIGNSNDGDGFYEDDGTK